MPRLRFKNYAELNAWLTDKCIAYAKAHRLPELTEQTIWVVFETERSQLVAYAGRLRWLPCGADVGLEDLPGSLRHHKKQASSACDRWPTDDPLVRP
jgi:hypothetical protein